MEEEREEKMGRRRDEGSKRDREGSMIGMVDLDGGVDVLPMFDSSITSMGH